MGALSVRALTLHPPPLLGAGGDGPAPPMPGTRGTDHGNRAAAWLCLAGGPLVFAVHTDITGTPRHKAPTVHTHIYMLMYDRV